MVLRSMTHQRPGLLVKFLLYMHVLLLVLLFRVIHCFDHLICFVGVSLREHMMLYRVDKGVVCFVVFFLKCVRSNAKSSVRTSKL
jgi:hypothetical protein